MNMQAGVWTLFFLEMYMTVNLFPVRGSVMIYSMTAKVPYDQIEAIHQSIDHLLYCVSTLWSAWPSHSGPEDIQCCYSYRTVHCDTSEAARELKDTPPLNRTNWSFNYWGLFLCVFARLDPHFWIPIPYEYNIFDCVRLHNFECACELCILCACILPSFSAEQSSVGM